MNDVDLISGPHNSLYRSFIRQMDDERANVKDLRKDKIKMVVANIFTAFGIGICATIIGFSAITLPISPFSNAIVIGVTVVALTILLDTFIMRNNYIQYINAQLETKQQELNKIDGALPLSREEIVTKGITPLTSLFISESRSFRNFYKSDLFKGTILKPVWKNLFKKYL